MPPAILRAPAHARAASHRVPLCVCVFVCDDDEKERGFVGDSFFVFWPVRGGGGMSAWKKTRKGFVCLSFCCCLNFFVTCVHFFFCAVVPDDGLERKMISIQNETENRFVNLSEA